MFSTRIGVSQAATMRPWSTSSPGFCPRYVSSLTTCIWFLAAWWVKRSLPCARLRGMPIPIVCSWSTRFHGPGLEEMPEAVLAVLGESDEAVRVPFDMDAPPIEALQAGLPGLADLVEERADETPIVLVGECTLAPAVIAGMRRRHPAIALVWIDAHGDLNTPETTPSGFLGGMPFAVILGWALPEVATAAGLGEPVPVERAVLVDGRDLDPGERANVERSGLARVDDVAAALEVLPPDVPLHVHLDTDVVDPAGASRHGLPCPGRLERRADARRVLCARGDGTHRRDQRVWRQRAPG